MMTSFTRIVVVLSLLRTALGTATAPPNSVIIALAMFLTAFVMGPVLQKSYDDGIKPLVANQIGVEEALQKASVPLRGFMGWLPPAMVLKAYETRWRFGSDLSRGQRAAISECAW